MEKSAHIEIRYAPGGDENSPPASTMKNLFSIEIRYAPGGDENYQKKNAVLSDEEKN